MSAIETSFKTQDAAEREIDIVGKFLEQLRGVNIPYTIFTKYHLKVLSEELTPEEAVSKACIDAGIVKRVSHVVSLMPFYNVAEQWVAKENLNTEEVAHGVAHDAFVLFHQHHYKGDVDPTFKPGDAYAEVYNARKADSIRQHLVKSAMELFD